MIGARIQPQDQHMSIRQYQGHTPSIADSAYIDEMALVIGRVTIGEHSSLWPNVVARGDVQTITIGNSTNVQDGTIIHVTHDHDAVPGGQPTRIGDFVTIGHRALIHACAIGDYCLIGMAATIMDGAVLEDRVILGAGSLVPPGKILESGHLYVGSPAKKVRPLNEKELANLEYSASHYVHVAETHKQGNV